MKFPSNEYRFPFFESGGIVLYLTLTIRPLDTARVPGSLEARIYKPATRVVLPPPHLVHVHSTPKESINPFTTMGNEFVVADLEFNSIQYVNEIDCFQSEIRNGL